MSKKLILAYCGDGSLNKITPDDAKRLTHVNIAFGTVTKDGLLDSSKLTHLDYINTIKQWNPDLKFVLSVGGWGAGGFSTMALTEEGRRAFARSCADFAAKYELDGIDIDWEYPCNDSANIDADPRDKEDFTYLLQELRDALGNDKIVSIAAGAGSYFVRDTEMDKVAEICTYVQLMTYDMRSGFCRQAGHHTALYAAKGDDNEHNTADIVDIFNKAGVPLEKIVIGSAFYSRHWTGVPTENNGLLQQAESLGNYGAHYSELVNSFIDKNGFTRIWDDDAKAPYLVKEGELYSYDDPESVKEKCIYLKKKGLLGIMYWEHSCDDTHTLLKTMADNL